MYVCASGAPLFWPLRWMSQQGGIRAEGRRTPLVCWVVGSRFLQGRRCFQVSSKICQDRLRESKAMGAWFVVAHAQSRAAQRYIRLSVSDAA